jgi:ketosteroid isomerase-like protein
MSVEENKAIVKRFREAISKGDSAAVREILSPDFFYHTKRK